MKNAVATSVALTLPVGIFGSISYIFLGEIWDIIMYRLTNKTNFHRENRLRRKDKIIRRRSIVDNNK